MNKRDFLKLLPLVAVSATTVKIDNVEAQVRELNPQKKYLIVIPDIDPDKGPEIARGIRERFGDKVVLLGGDATTALKVYELQ